MKFRTGAKAGTHPIELELDDDDMTSVPGWSQMGLGEKFKVMSTKADILVVNYLYSHGDITKEYAEQRLREIREASK